MKKQQAPTKICSECVHEFACQMWNIGNIHNMNATNCQNHETVTESPAYLIGFMDGKSKKDTNADRIRAMTDEELAMYFAGMADEDIYNDPGAWLAWLQNSYKEGAE